MNVDDLYNKLDKIFVDYTTHQWKNGWENEADRKSKSLTVQKEVRGYNIFLLQKYDNGFELQDSNSFEIQFKYDGAKIIRVDIEINDIDLDIYYFVDNELDWLDTQDFIVELCQKVYNSKVLYYESIKQIPGSLYGKVNPDFTKSYRRDRQLNKIL